MNISGTQLVSSFVKMNHNSETENNSFIKAGNNKDNNNDKSCNIEHSDDISNESFDADEFYHVLLLPLKKADRTSNGKKP